MRCYLNLGQKHYHYRTYYCWFFMVFCHSILNASSCIMSRWEWSTFWSKTLKNYPWCIFFTCNFTIGKSRMLAKVEHSWLAVRIWVVRWLANSRDVMKIQKFKNSSWRQKYLLQEVGDVIEIQKFKNPRWRLCINKKKKTTLHEELGIDIYFETYFFQNKFHEMLLSTTGGGLATGGGFWPCTQSIKKVEKISWRHWDFFKINFT